MSCLPVWRVPDDLLKEWIRHSNLRVTADYTHFTDDFRQKIASDFGLVRAEMVPIGPNSTEDGKHSNAAQRLIFL